jgi:hypothetical protein
MLKRESGKNVMVTPGAMTMSPVTSVTDETANVWSVYQNP